jgi:hypothetical protein
MCVVCYIENVSVRGHVNVLINHSFIARITKNGGLDVIVKVKREKKRRKTQSEALFYIEKLQFCWKIDC